MAKPTGFLEWTDGAPAKVIEPTAGKKGTGWLSGEKPSFQFMNWLFFRIDEWLQYFDGEIENVKATGTAFDAVVGTGGTHADLAALMADPDVALKKNIIVVSPTTLTSTVTIDENDMTFTFKPQAQIFASPGMGVGLEIDAERVRIINGRFANFSSPGDIALQLSAASKYCMVENCFFNSCDTTIDDQGTQNATDNNIEEL